MSASGGGAGDSVGDRTSLLEVARLSIVHLQLEDFADLKRAMTTAARVSAETLDVARVGIWSLVDEGMALRRVVLHDERETGELESRDWKLPLASWPGYRAAILSRRMVAVEDAVTDLRTAEMAADYLIPNGVSSMLDAPLFVGGEVWGVVCHEQVGLKRIWSKREIDFATSVADMLSAMLEQALRLALEERLREAEAALSRSREAEAVVKTAAAIGHDINTLLQAISGRAELAARSEGPVDPSDLIGIMNDCQRAARVVSQLRELERPARSVGQETDLSFVIEDTRETLEALLGPTHSLTIELAAAATVPARRADVERIVLNLVVNAKEAMPDGGVVRLAVHRTAAAVSLQVTDQGKGITAEQATRVFEPYFTTKSGRNSGLGLFAVQAIARNTGATVSLDSSPGTGTSVSVKWPVAPA
ncbi:MAG TPA: HAMP domain-containing sensor histidine kinase [Polyangiaceae bacterium]